MKEFPVFDTEEREDEAETGCIRYDGLSEEETRARKKALVLLNAMDRTEAQLLEKLMAAGFSRAASLDALAYVKKLHYVDDRRFAESYLRTVGTRRSLRRIAYDLKTRGVPSEIIDDLMADQADRDESELIARLAEKKLRQLDPDDPNTKRKLMAHLSSKGFRMSDILNVTDRLLS